MSPQRTLLLLGAGPEQIEALHVARELGYRTVAFDNDPEAPGRAWADAFQSVDLKNPHALLAAAEGVAPDGVFVHAAELAVEAARIAEAFDLPGLSPDVADRATDKSRRIRALADADIRTPDFQVLEAADSLEAWTKIVEAHGFPCVLKPTDQAGARGVEEIENREDLSDYYTRRLRFTCAQFVCEARLSGLQLSTESVAQSGKTLHHAIALRHYDTTEIYRPFFVEDGHSLPYALPGPLQSEVETLIERCFAALGVEDGVLKGDLLITEAGEIYVLEMAVRTSGGRFADTVVPLSTGVNILYPLIERAMNDTSPHNWFQPTRKIGVSQRFFLHPGACAVRRWPAIRQLVAQPQVSEWRLNPALFKSNRLPAVESHRDRLGYLICTGATREEADAQALEITTSFAHALELGAQHAD